MTQYYVSTPFAASVFAHEHLNDGLRRGRALELARQVFEIPHHFPARWAAETPSIRLGGAKGVQPGQPDLDRVWCLTSDKVDHVWLSYVLGS